jgi:hypothetical protein
MMPFTQESAVFTMPLTLKAHQIADQFRQQQSNPQKAKQVYLNTLAVLAVQSYLSWFGIETDLAASDSWNGAMQALADTADLVIRHRGKLECRPVLPGAESCDVPPEVRSDRLGYVAVQFNQELNEATLLGFVPAVTGSEIALQQLRSLDELLDYLHLTEQAESSNQPVQLRQWLQGVVEMGWQTIDQLLGRPQAAWSFRSGEQLQEVDLPTTRGKLIDLELMADDAPLALVVGLLPVDESSMDIWVRLFPTGNQTCLPPELELLVLDEAEVAVMQAQSRNTEIIQLKFKGMLGEKFSIQIISGTQSITETFVL